MKMCQELNENSYCYFGSNEYAAQVGESARKRSLLKSNKHLCRFNAVALCVRNGERLEA